MKYFLFYLTLNIAANLLGQIKGTNEINFKLLDSLSQLNSTIKFEKFNLPLNMEKGVKCREFAVQKHCFNSVNVYFNPSMIDLNNSEAVLYSPLQWSLISQKNLLMFISGNLKNGITVCTIYNLHTEEIQLKIYYLDNKFIGYSLFDYDNNANVQETFILRINTPLSFIDLGLDLTKPETMNLLILFNIDLKKIEDGFGYTKLHTKRSLHLDSLM